MKLEKHVLGIIFDLEERAKKPELYKPKVNLNIYGTK